jgi:transcriptional regulator with XRE-family HTH domain
MVKHIGERLKLVRTRLGLTQAELAKALGVSRFAVIKWEKGERDVPSSIYEVLGKQFGVNLNWLLTGEGEPFIATPKDPVKKKDLYEGLSQEDRELLELIKNLPPKDKDLVIQLLKRVAMASTSGSTSETPKKF